MCINPPLKNINIWLATATLCYGKLNFFTRPLWIRTLCNGNPCCANSVIPFKRMRGLWVFFMQRLLPVDRLKLNSHQKPDVTSVKVLLKHLSIQSKPVLRPLRSHFPQYQLPASHLLSSCDDNKLVDEKSFSSRKAHRKTWALMNHYRYC